MSEPFVTLGAPSRPAGVGAAERGAEQPALDDAELARIVRIVRATLAAEMPLPAVDAPSVWQRTFEACNKYWVMVVVLASLAGIAGAALFLGADPFYKFREIKIAGEEARDKENKFAFDREMVRHYVTLGERYLDVWQLAEAAKAFDEALKLDGADLAAARGRIKAQMFAPPAGGAYDPEVLESRITIVRDMAQADGEKDGAVGAYDPHALTALADLRLRAGETGAARELYTQAIALRPSLAHAHSGLGLIALQQRRDADAETAEDETAPAVREQLWSRR